MKIPTSMGANVMVGFLMKVSVSGKKYVLSN